MENLVVKIKLAVLWLFWIVAFLVHVFLELLEKGAIEQIIAGEFAGVQITSDAMLWFAIFMLVPLVMAFISLTLKDIENRRANMILGVVYNGLCFYNTIGGLADSSGYDYLMYASKIYASALIVWIAYEWKV